MGAFFSNLCHCNLYPVRGRKPLLDFVNHNVLQLQFIPARGRKPLVPQSLIQHWNSAFPECALTDPDAFHALAQGLRILDYDLRTTRYLLKEARIPALRGSMTLEARLAPLLALWNALLTFAPFGGIGIKTTLGMGGTETEFIPARFPDGHRAAL